MIVIAIGIFPTYLLRATVEADASVRDVLVRGPRVVSGVNAPATLATHLHRD